MSAADSSGPPDHDAGVITGIAAEGRALARGLHQQHNHLIDRLERRLGCAGADAVRAEALARGLLDGGARSLVSFGIAGGLDPALRPGALVLAEEVVLPGGGAVAADAAWRARLLARLQDAGRHAVGGRLLGSARVIAAPRDKQDCFEVHRAAAVDMESHAVAAVAEQASVPLLIVRAVADSAERALPRLVIGSIGADGEPRGGLVAGRLLLQPWTLPALMRLRGDARSALRTLSEVARIAGPALLGRV